MHLLIQVFLTYELTLCGVDKLHALAVYTLKSLLTCNVQSLVITSEVTSDVAKNLTLINWCVHSLLITQNNVVENANDTMSEINLYSRE